MVMDNYYQQDTRQLWEKINSLHLSYLGMEESTQKLEHRNKLEDYINDYLCLVPHDQKFEFQYTSEVLYKSARCKDFSGYKAALGWDAIGRYAANLITKSWRREYRRIKMYSGFYKHEIESNLVGAEMMFEAMGYNWIRSKELLILEGPICPDRVTSVSLDSLIAYVECQILKVVWEEVNNVFKVSWFDVLKFRNLRPSSPKELISSIIYHIQNKRHIQDRSLSFPATETKLQMQHNYMSHPPMYAALPPQPPHIAPACMYPVNSCYGGYLPYPPPPYYMPVSCVPINQPYVSAQYKYNPVPTAQLIELDHTYDTPDAPIASHKKYESSVANTIKTDEIEKKLRQMSLNDRKTPSEPKYSDKEEGSGTYESWDYVYRNLESQGYSKDLGERGDILSRFVDEEPKPKSKATKSKNEIRERRKSNTDLHENAYNNIPEMPKPTKTSTLRTEKAKQLQQQQQATNGTISRVEKPKKQEQPKILEKQQAVGGDWHCKTCTFLNKASKDICEMCSKSKNTKVVEMEIGGSQCNKCTFVNSKDDKICSVCFSSLNNTPTYI